MNDQLILVSGESGSGKSMSLMNLRNQERWMYLNCESGKRLPFKNTFDKHTINDPLQIYEAADYAYNNQNYDGVIIDTLTFLMDMYESQYVLGAANTMAAWGEYAQYFKNLMQTKVSVSDKSFIFLAHTKDELDEKTMTMRTNVPVKGALKNQGIEAYFSTVVSTKKIPLKDLEEQDQTLLNITEQDEILKYKHVFQTALTQKTVGERIRSPMGLFTNKQVYIDNDCQMLLDHLNEYYKE